MEPGRPHPVSDTIYPVRMPECLRRKFFNFVFGVWCWAFGVQPAAGAFRILTCVLKPEAAARGSTSNTKRSTPNSKSSHRRRHTFPALQLYCSHELWGEGAPAPCASRHPRFLLAFHGTARESPRPCHKEKSAPCRSTRRPVSSLQTWSAWECSRASATRLPEGSLLS